MSDTIAPSATPEAAPAASHGAIDAAPATPAVESADSIRADIGKYAREGADELDLGKALESVAAKGEAITLADLRAIPGMEKYSDAEIQATWDEVRGAKPEAKPAATETPAKPRAYKVYLDGKEVTDLDKLTWAELKRAQFGYQANKAEQRKSIDEVVRNAQLGHFHAERMNTLQQNLTQALAKTQTYEQELAPLRENNKLITGALDAAARGNLKPLEELVQGYIEALNNGQPGGQPEARPAAEPNAEHHATGMQVYTEYVWPESDKLAKEFGLDTKQVADGIMYLVQQEHPSTATPERLRQIVEQEIRFYLEDFARDRDAAAAAPAADPRDAKIAELEAKLAAKGATSEGAEQHNSHVAEVHRKRKAAPPSHGSAPGPANGIESPDFKSGEDAKQWIRNLKL